MLYNWMPSWAKSKLLGVSVGVGGGIASGVEWHIMATRIDPPSVVFFIIEAGLIATLILLRRPKTPHSPNFNLIPTLTRCPLPT